MALDRDLSALGLNQRLNYGQAKAMSTFCSRSRGVGSVETLKKVRQMLCGDAFPRVAYHQRRACLAHCDLSRGGVGRGVLEQIADYLAHGIWVDLDRGFIKGHFKSGIAFQTSLVNRLGNDRSQSVGGDLKSLPRVHTRQRKQNVGQLVHRRAPATYDL